MVSGKWKYLQDWFGFYPEWFVGAPVIILLLYVATLISLIPGSKEYLFWLSHSVNEISLVFLFILIPIGFLVRLGKIAKNLRNVYGVASELRVIASMMLEVLTIGFGLAFGLLGLFSFTIVDPVMFWILFVANLSYANVCAIMSRTVVRESPIGNYFLSLIWRLVDYLRK